MPKVPFTAFFYGPQAVYTSSTGQQDPITGLPYLGTDLQSGNYADLSEQDAQTWNRQFALSPQLHGGRYRFVAVASYSSALTANNPVGWGLGTSVQEVSFTAGSGYTAGTYNVSSSAPGGTTAAVAQVVVGTNGTIIAASIVSGGSGFSPQLIPTFTLTALGAGSGGAVTAHLTASGYTISSFDSTADSDTSMVRGIALAAVSATQVAAGAWIVIQEEGIAPVLIGTATSTTAGAQIVAVNGGTANSQNNAYSALEIGRALDAPVAGQIIRVVLTLPDLAL